MRERTSKEIPSQEPMLVLGWFHLFWFVDTNETTGALSKTWSHNEKAAQAAF